MSNYPPGVTGNEYEIAGPDTEQEGEHHCPNCDKTTPGMFYSYRRDRWWRCDECDYTFDIDDDEL